jgi:hypothetical protein
MLDNTARIGAEEAYFPTRTPKADHNLWSSRINMQDAGYRPRGEEPASLSRRFESTKPTQLRFRALLTQGDTRVLFHREGVDRPEVDLA